MIILTIRTDNPESELSIYDDQQQLGYYVWQAHRQLAETLHLKINEMLKRVEVELGQVDGIVVYKGPGSFTGLRIGLSVANALAYSLQVPIVATGDDWIEQGIQLLLAGKSDRITLPEYGAPVHITQQKK